MVEEVFRWFSWLLGLQVEKLASRFELFSARVVVLLTNHAEVTVKSIELSVDLCEGSILAKIVRRVVGPVARGTGEHEIRTDDLAVTCPDIGGAARAAVCLQSLSSGICFDFTPATLFISFA